MSTTETEPIAADAPPCWPPVAHIVRRENLPAKEGDIALCGARLMGLNLDGAAVEHLCEKCIEIVRREMS